MTAHSWNEDARHTNLQKLLTLADAFVPIKCSAVLNKLWVIDVLIDEMNGSLGAIVRDFDPEETSARPLPIYPRQTKNSERSRTAG